MDFLKYNINNMKCFKYNDRTLAQLFNFKYSKEKDLGYCASNISEIDSEINADIILIYRDDIPTISFDYLNKWNSKKEINNSIKIYGKCEYSNYLKKLL